MPRNHRFRSWLIPSLSARRAWIEIAGTTGKSKRAIKSLSARRAWIEISRAANCQHRSHVALRKESVDRNKHTQPAEQTQSVALRKESVDRNDFLNLSNV